jgi:DNA-binding CsgD family transcriptional regulator
LNTALALAWRHQSYASVVRLASGLAYAASRRTTFAEAEYVLRLGVEASRRIRDTRSTAHLLNRLGGVAFSFGIYQQGWRLWYTGLRLARFSGSYLGLWDPFSSFAQTVDMLGTYAVAHDFAETLVRAQRRDDRASIAVALFARGLYARFAGHLDHSREDFLSCLMYLDRAVTDAASSSQQLFRMAVQAELARVQGDYVRSQIYTESALALAQIFSDRYTVAALLIDQAYFTFRQGHLDDTYTAFLRLRELERQTGLPHVCRCRTFLSQHLPRALLQPHSRNTPLLTTLFVNINGQLSERELEVLQLVAAGHSNAEIAGQLVITASTVKKHLEHIYIKLNARSRTSAVAIARTLNFLP